MKFVSYRRHNSTGAFCVWVKELGYDFSTELTENSDILSTYHLRCLTHGDKLLPLIYDTSRVEDLLSPCKSLRIRYNSNVVLSDFIL